MKKSMIKENDDFKKFRVSEDLNERIMSDFFSWCRFVEFDENIALLY
jgi:hypothetical protein